MTAIASLILALLLGPGAGAALHASAAGHHPVEARLLADVEAVVPGRPLRLGVELRMEEGWHTYWRFSGAAGLPTEVDWRMPPGFAAAPLQWPLPARYSEEGGLTVYGYAGEVLLIAPVTPPPLLPADSTVSFAAGVSWLVCREVCIPGEATVTLDLPVDSNRVTRANQEIFGPFAAQVPQPLAADLRRDHLVRRSSAGMRVDLAVAMRRQGPGPEPQVVDFFPFGAAAPAVGPAQLFEEDGRVRLRFGVEPLGGQDPGSLQGVVLYRFPGEEEIRFGEVDLDLRAGSRQGGPDFASATGAGFPGSLGFYLLLAVLGGLVLNLMPCVLPVISLKVLGLVAQAGEERRRTRHLGLAFAAGIVATFLVLAALVVLLKRGGEQIGWGFQFQYPGFVAAMAALVFVLGLSLFGVFSVRLPGTGAGLQAAAGRQGLAGSFLNGVLATILATPCSAPFLGTALGFAFSQPGALVWAVFAAIGAGMALPYLVLALEPSWMRFLPRPGAWMELFKQLMGFLLMATVLWLLWVLGHQVGLEGVVWTGAFLLCAALACWILGQWVDLGSSTVRRWAARGAAAAIVAAAYAIFLRPALEQERVPSSPAGEGTLAWQPFSSAGLEELLDSGRHVFIDFTAEWCWTCKVNERAVLADPRVRARFAELNVALVKADWTHRDAEITRWLRAFGRSAVPLYVIFPGGGSGEPVVLPEILTTGLLLKKLEETAAAGPRRGT